MHTWRDQGSSPHEEYLRPSAGKVDLAGGLREGSLRLDLIVTAAIGHADDDVAGAALEERAAQVAPDGVPRAKRVRLPRVPQAHVWGQDLARVGQHKAAPAVERVDGADHRLDLGLCVSVAAELIPGRRLANHLARCVRVEREDRAEADVSGRVKAEEVVRRVA